MDTTVTASPASRTAERFVFTGRTGDYFGIWIVNLLLTIVTVGIYSAWAKVRRVRYFYGNTFLGDHSFDYHARPIAILKGRLIVVAVIILLNVLSAFAPIAGIVASIALAVLIPFAVLLSLRFNARVSSWRNVRFDFELKPSRDFFRGFLVFGLMPIVAVASLGLLLPVATRLAWNFMLSRLRFGSTPFSADIRLAPLYRALLASLLAFIGAAAIIAIAGAAAYFLVDPASIDFEAMSEEEFAFFIGIFPIVVGSFVGFFAVAIAGTVYSALARNAILGATKLGDIASLTSDMSGLRMGWIAISNTLLILLTAGLATPYAAIRSWRYRTETVGASITGSIDGIIAAEVAAGNAVGSEWADIEGFDVGF